MCRCDQWLDDVYNSPFVPMMASDNATEGENRNGVQPATASTSAPDSPPAHTHTEYDQSIPDSESVYFFESDHVALQGSKDYRALLRTIALLEAQRSTAILDLDKLVDCEAEAMADPIGFVNKLQHGVDLGLPKAQKIASISHVDWDKYTSNVDSVIFGRHKHMTRNKKTADEDSTNLPTADGMVTPPDGSRPGTPLSVDMGDLDDPNSAVVIRGRVKDESKPVTFNQLWTAEEQQRLEGLLLEFPPEEVEARRWDKIARALGNRTTQQVASRVQKYFIKLAKAGLPVPGRLPNLNAQSKKGGPHRHQRYNKFYFQPSTFLQSYEPPVFMSDDDDDDTASWTTSSMDVDARLPQWHSENVEISDEEDIAEDLKGGDEYEELLCLKAYRHHRMRDQELLHHVGYKCDRCDRDPIIGTRWHCADCPTATSLDFCDDCMDSPFETSTHNSSHRLQPIRYAHHEDSVPHADKDYTRFLPGDYSYLDPNFMPIT